MNKAEENNESVQQPYLLHPTTGEMASTILLRTSACGIRQPAAMG